VNRALHSAMRRLGWVHRESYGRGRGSCATNRVAGAAIKRLVGVVTRSESRGDRKRTSLHTKQIIAEAARTLVERSGPCASRTQTLDEGKRTATETIVT
jgi:hypothetical protein